MSLLGEYAFDDCLLVDLSVSQHLEDVSITCEAYPVDSAGVVVGKKQLIAVRCMKPQSVRATVHPELWTDLRRGYDPRGDDYRANEIQELRGETREEGQVTLRLSADMLELTVECSEILVAPACG